MSNLREYVKIAVTALIAAATVICCDQCASQMDNANPSINTQQ